MLQSCELRGLASQRLPVLATAGLASAVTFARSIAIATGFALGAIALGASIIAILLSAAPLSASDADAGFPPPTPGRVFSADREGNCLLVNRDGYVITCNHVVSGSQTVVVSFCGEGRRFGGVVSVVDSSADLALIKLTDFDAGITGIHPAVFADSVVAMAVGDEVRIHPADRLGRCDAGVFAHVYSVRPGEEMISAFGLFNGHSGAALVQRGSGLVVGSLHASEVAWSEGSEHYLMPPYRFMPASSMCGFLDRAGADFSKGHPVPPESRLRRWARHATLIGFAACVYAGASEYSTADDYYDDYRAMSGWGSTAEIRSLRLSIEDHDEQAQYWLGAAVVLGAAALWQYEVPQRLWGRLRGTGQ